MDNTRRLSFLLLVSVLVISTCGLIYELIAGTLASYLLGDTVTQFSTIIGVYLFSMGIGSYLSKFVKGNLLKTFISVEIWVGIVGGISSTILFFSFEMVESFSVILYLLICITGTLVGLEIPLLMRILNEYQIGFKEIVSRVFTYDYVGALVASLVFPLFFVPKLGLIKTSYFFGMLNVAVAILIVFRFGEQIKRAAFLKIFSVTALVLLTVGFIYGEKIMKLAESYTYPDKIIFSQSSSYQRIVLTKGRNDLRLFLNGNLQFSSQDEYRYHEALVHPVMLNAAKHENVLILGGGDGLAVREILRYPDVKSVTLVDLDKALTDLFSTSEPLRSLNKNSLLSPRLQIVNADAFVWVREQTRTYDCIIVDFPDPSNYSLGKLYTNVMFSHIARLLANDGSLVIQSTSPLFAPKSFWCIDNTMQSVGLRTLPYHCYVPSFGEWGYILANKTGAFDLKNTSPDSLRFFSKNTFATMTDFPADMHKRETEINRLNNQNLVNYFEKEWSTYTP